MTMRNRLLIGLATTLLLSLGIIWLFWPERQIGPATFHRIQEGMTAAEVEGLIGLPPGDYYTGPRSIGGVTSRGPYGWLREERGLPFREIPKTWHYESERKHETGCMKAWWGNDFAINVAFNKSDEVVSWQLFNVVPAVRGPGIFDRLQQWIGW